MRKIILNLAVTLDGFIEGPNGEIDWCRMDIDPVTDSSTESHFDKFLSRIDAIFCGRVSYDMWGQYQPEENASIPEKKLWQGVHSKKKYVFSHEPRSDSKAVYVSDDIVSKVNEIKSEPGKDIWLYGGANLITTFINARLVDKYLLAIFPVVLGAGKPLFANIKDRVGLEFNSVETSPSGVILLDYDTKK
jgi:dihydrofolate reductase